MLQALRGQTYRLSGSHQYGFPQNTHPALHGAYGTQFTFQEKWDAKYPAIPRSWNRHWQNIVTIFAFPDEIREIIYTTNAIESLNSVIRKAINQRKIFPNNTSAWKVVWLATQKASQKWTMSLRDWRAAMNRFAIEFEGRITE